MCHRANYQEDGPIQISIPEPPLRSRFRSQKTQRAAGRTANSTRPGRTAWRLQVADLIVEKRLRWRQLPPGEGGGEYNCKFHLVHVQLCVPVFFDVCCGRRFKRSEC